jgi:hypothetical protein
MILLASTYAILTGDGIDQVGKHQVYRCFDVMLPAIVNDFTVHIIDLGFPFIDQVDRK